MGKFFLMLKILGIGNALVDVMTLMEDDSLLGKFSLPKGSMQLVDKEKSDLIRRETAGLKTSLSSGGSAANTIHGLAKLGVQTGYTGSVGRDDFGAYFTGDMQKEGVKTFLKHSETPTGNAVALISPDTERTFATYLGAAIELRASDLKKEDFRGFDILYLEGYLLPDRLLIETACNFAREYNMKVALDLASYNVVEANLQVFKEVAGKYVDILFANELEAKAFTGKDPEEALEILARLCEIAVVKVGSEGSWIRRGEEIIRIGTEKLNVRDTTGAGDLYATGFLYGYSSGRNLELCGQFGSLVAGNVIEILGARMNEKRWDTIKKQIASIS